MTDIRKSLENLADAIEQIDNRPAPAPVINDRSLSGNKINGGIITNFSSVGIADNSTKRILVVTDTGIKVSNANIDKISNDLQIKGSLNVDGEIFAKKLHVDEITADLRNERTSPLEFKAENGKVYNKGLLWSGNGHTKQLVMQGGPDRIWSSEHIDIHQDREYKIGNETVISKDTLGTGIVSSNLRSVGSLRSLNVEGSFVVDEFFRYNPDVQQLSLGAESPNGMLTMESWDHQFIIDPSDDNQWKLGTWTTSALHIVTDDTVRLTVGANGNITVNSKTSFLGNVGIGVKNFAEDVQLTVAGPVRIDGRKFQVSDSTPTSGTYQKGDIVWSETPKPTGYVGWVCVREGTPGEWKAFGQIAS
jgi:hypothetical protein